MYTINNVKDVFIGIDCGLKGAIAILYGNAQPEIYDMPTYSSDVIRKNKLGKNVVRKKQNYDITGIMKIFSKYKAYNVTVFIEKQGVRPKEGAISAMTIGQGFGTLIGVSYGLGFKVKIVSPQEWKKRYPEISTKSIKISLDKEIKDLMSDKSYTKNKLNDKIRVLIKKEAKSIARQISSKLYPEIADSFGLVSYDGRADALLICLFGSNYDLV